MMRFWLAISSLPVLAGAAALEITNAPAPVPLPVAPLLHSGSELVSFWNALIVAVVPLAVAGIRSVLPRLPKLLWPVLAMVFGVAGEWLLSQSGATGGSWEVGALCGAAGIGLREITKQLLPVLIRLDVPKGNDHKECL
jgi:hypothetical protein